MSRAAKIAFAFISLAAAALVIAGCATDIGGARVSARVGTRIPAAIYQNGDGTAYQIEAIDPPGSSFFLIVRGRY
jgi:hypothetical protein